MQERCSDTSSWRCYRDAVTYQLNLWYLFVPVTCRWRSTHAASRIFLTLKATLTATAHSDRLGWSLSAGSSAPPEGLSRFLTPSGWFWRLLVTVTGHFSVPPQLPSSLCLHLCFHHRLRWTTKSSKSSTTAPETQCYGWRYQRCCAVRIHRQYRSLLVMSLCTHGTRTSCPSVGRSMRPIRYWACIAIRWLHRRWRGPRYSRWGHDGQGRRWHDRRKRSGRRCNG